MHAQTRRTSSRLYSLCAPRFRRIQRTLFTIQQWGFSIFLFFIRGQWGCRNKYSAGLMRVDLKQSNKLWKKKGFQSHHECVCLSGTRLHHRVVPSSESLHNSYCKQTTICILVETFKGNLLKVWETLGLEQESEMALAWSNFNHNLKTIQSILGPPSPSTARNKAVPGK